MPKSFRVEQGDVVNNSPGKRKEVVEDERSKIVDHFRSCRCLVCGLTTTEGGVSASSKFGMIENAFNEELCRRCLWDPYKAILSLSNRVKKLERRLMDTHSICSSCTGAAMSEQIECMSTDCPWLYSRKKAEEKADQVARLRELVKELEFNTRLGGPVTLSPSPEPEEDHTRESSAETTFWPME